jgi:predicted outer membrane protein
MGKYMVTIAAGAALLAVCLATAPAFSQRARFRGNEGAQGNQQPGASQPTQQYGRTQAGFRGETTRTPLADWQIAEWLIVDNQGEIALAEKAEQAASDDDVKEFAQNVLDDHHKFLQKLQRQVGATNRGGQPTVRQGQGAAAAARSAVQGLDIVAVKQQLGEECRKSALHELGQKNGAEFDKCYMGMQIGMHMQMLDALKVFSRYASPELDRLIEEGQDTTQEHLERAKHIMASLEGKRDRSSRSARRESRETEKSGSSEKDSNSSRSSNRSSKND